MARSVGIDRQYREAVQQRRLWTPAHLPQKPAFFDATNSPSLVQPSGVSDWTDSLGLGITASQSTAGNRPTVEARAEIGGGNALRFASASSQHLAFASNFLSGASSGYLLAVAWIANDPPGSGAAAGHPFGITVGGSHSHWTFTDGAIYEAWGTSARKTVGNPTPSLAVPRIYEAISAPSDFRALLDGSQIYSTGTNTVSWGSAPVIGRSGPAATSYLNGWIAAIIATGSVPSPADCARTRAALAMPRGLARNLAGSPYRNRPPLIGGG
jgi:hypothetical protein